jgi:hypothetical protein
MATKRRTRCELCAMTMAALVAVVAALRPAMAQETDNLTIEVAECVELATPEERLACFEAQVEAARPERAASENRRRAAEPSRPATDDGRRADEPSAGAPSAEPRVEPARAADRTRSSERRREQRGPRGGDPDEAEVVARVAALRETLPNSYVITLDNGQVWRQTRPQSYPLRPGAEVRIYPTSWGDSYRLTMPEARGGYVQVERVR